jgi:hypothetical protein
MLAENVMRLARTIKRFWTYREIICSSATSPDSWAIATNIPTHPLEYMMTAIPLVALSPIAEAVSALYGMGVAINDYLDRHIQEMKGSENPTVSRTGAVLEMAKYGFGVGYLSSVVVIGVGQLLLGNTLAAVTAVASAATFTNPVAMTCAAVGAIYYGWGALSDAERNTILDNMSRGLEIGVEFIKAILAFIIDTTKNLMSSKNFEEIKGYIGAAAGVFGRTLGDVTHKLSDVVSDTFDVFRKKSSEALDSTIELGSDAYSTVKETTEKAVGSTRVRLQKMTSRSESA